MGCCAQCGSDDLCLCDAFVTPEQVVGSTLLDGLGPLVDCLRGLNTTLGARTYQVQLVWTRWTGGSRGRGQETLVQVLPLLPTPKVSALKAISLELTNAGQNEQGQLEVSELSPSYTEDLLMGRDGPVVRGQDLPPDMQFWWEIYQPEPGVTSPRRRFFPKSAPSYDATALQWRIQLVQQQRPRARDGRVLV